MTALHVVSITFFLLKLYFVDSNMFYFALQFCYNYQIPIHELLNCCGLIL